MQDENVRFVDPNAFMQEGDKLYLKAGKCKACGFHLFPKVNFCPQCGAMEMEDAPISERGTLYSWTVSHMVMGGSDLQPPYALGLVDMPEGIRVGALLDGTEFEIGDEMQLRIEKVWKDNEGNDVIGYKFAKVEV